MEVETGATLTMPHPRLPLGDSPRKRMPRLHMATRAGASEEYVMAVSEEVVSRQHRHSWTQEVRPALLTEKRRRTLIEQVCENG